jgi:opacity protein-like surface antigen
MTRRWWPLAAAVLFSTMAIPASAAERPVRFGVQGSWANDADFGIGARVDVGLADKRAGLGAVGSFDYFFPSDDELELLDVDVTYWEANANLTYTLSGDLAPYVGAGLNIAHASAGLGIEDFTVADESETDVGLNLLGGVRLSDRIFAEARIELGGGEMFIVTAGFMF